MATFVCWFICWFVIVVWFVSWFIWLFIWFFFPLVRYAGLFGLSVVLFIYLFKPYILWKFSPTHFPPTSALKCHQATVNPVPKAQHAWRTVPIYMSKSMPVAVNSALINRGEESSASHPDSRTSFDLLNTWLRIDVASSGFELKIPGR